MQRLAENDRSGTQTGLTRNYLDIHDCLQRDAAQPFPVLPLMTGMPAGANLPFPGETSNVLLADLGHLLTANIYYYLTAGITR